MKRFDYVVTDPAGIHARSAGILVKWLKSCAGVTVTVSRGDESVNARGLMALLRLGVKQGDAVSVSAEGENEGEVAAKIEEFFKAYF